MNKGKLIAIEGTDCAGKSSIIERLKIQLPILYDIKDYPFIFTREPGNDLTNNKRCLEIRKDLLTNKDLTIQQQTLLLAEARLIHTKDIINAIYNGYNVITDRYLLSSIIYQGSSIGIDTVINYNKEAIDLLLLNQIQLHNIIFQINEETYKQRIANRKENKDAIENVDDSIILNRIKLFSSLKSDNSNKVYTIDANGTDFDRIYNDTIKCINNIIKEE